MLLLAAGCAAFIASLAYALGCDNRCGWERAAQLVVACAGIVPVAAMVLLAVSRRWRQARAMLVVGVALYLVWAILLDADTHGWGEGPVPL